MYEDIKNLKELLDSGLITQQEYDSKKAKLLGLETAEDVEIREEVERAKVEHQERAEGGKLDKRARLKKRIPLIAIVAVALFALCVAYGLGYLGGQPQDDRLERERTARLVQETKKSLSPYTGSIGNAVTTDGSGKKAIEVTSEVWNGRTDIALMGEKGEVSFTAADGKCNGIRWKSKKEYNHSGAFAFMRLLDSYFGEESSCSQTENEDKGCWDQKYTWIDEETNCEVVLEYSNYGQKESNEKLTVVWTFR